MRRRTEKPVPPLPSPLQKRPGAWKRTPVTPPLKTNVPGKPSGNLERYLVSHRETRGVLGVVWDYSWFLARERAAQTHTISRELLYIELMPLFPDETDGRLSGKQIAERLGRTLHASPLNGKPK